MNLDRLLKPASVAVIGVSSQNNRHPANVIYKKIGQRRSIRVYAVNPRGGTLQEDKIYETLSAVPEPVDAVVVAARAAYVPDLIEECIRCKAGGAIVISGGFAEVGNQAAQDYLAKVAIAADFPMIGPNCLGNYAPGIIDTLFTPPERMERPQAGGVAFVSQSGGFLLDLLSKFANSRIGISQAVSIGNKAVVREIDLLRYFDRDPDTRVIAFYIEGFGENEGREFVMATRNCCKPVVVYKAGKSREGTRAVSSHTASIAGDYRVFSEILTQFGIVEAKNEAELVSFCKALNSYPRHIEENVCILTLSGGHGAAASDLCAASGFGLPPVPGALQDKIRDRLSSSVKDIASLGNPIDLTGSAVDEDFVAAYDILSTESLYDAILILAVPYPPGMSLDIGAKISNPSRKRVQPLIAYVPDSPKYQMFIEGFELNQVPVSDSISGAVMMLEAMRRYQLC